MNKVKILTDSCSDLTGTLLEKYNIDYCQMRTNYDGKVLKSDLRWTYEEIHSIYESMRAGNRGSTTQVPIEDFRKVFSNYAEQGYDIVYIGCSVKVSGSVNTATAVSKQLKSIYPNVNIYCVDSLNSSIGEGLLAIEAAKLVEAGKSAEEIYNHIIKIRKTVNEFCTVYTLDYLKKVGRVKSSSAFVDNLMHVKPILVTDAKGYQGIYKKAQGRKKSFSEIVNLMKDSIENPEKQTIYISHADCPSSEVQYLARLLHKTIPQAKVESIYMNPASGASIGPEAIGIWAFGKEVTWVAGE